MVIHSVIELLKGIEASSQVNPKSWRIVVAYRSLIEVKLMVIIVRKVGYFL